jgi:hypothetical protein
MGLPPAPATIDREARDVYDEVLKAIGDLRTREGLMLKARKTASVNENSLTRTIYPMDWAAFFPTR